jgi:transcriptional regulator with XRE-family HTH domain
MPTPLGEYLRARRNQLQPTDVGLPTSGRRRTPGLRREEVATLSGVSVDYLVRLEQGRDHNPSSSVLAALGSALRLDDEERTHLWSLAAMTAGHELCPVGRAVAELPVGVHQLVERLHPTPAFVLGPATDVLISNPAWRTTVEPLGLAPEAPNLARYVFTDDRAHRTFPDWERVADDLVGAVRQASTRGPDAAIDRLLDDLGDEPEFANRWANHVLATHLPAALRFVHPDVGEVRITPQHLFVADLSYARMIVWLPADRASADTLHQAATGTSGRLRLVGS